MFTYLDRLQPLGALILRLTLGAIMTAHGFEKIFHRGALYAFTHEVASLGMPPWLGYVSAFTEFFGGLLLILGLLTRVAALANAINMAVAVVKVHLHQGLTSNNGHSGFEFPLALFAIACMLVFTGAGYLALDDLVSRR